MCRIRYYREAAHYGQREVGESVRKVSGHADIKFGQGREISLVINTIIIFISKATSQLLGVFLLPIYTFFLTPEQYGFADLLLTYVLLLVPLCSVQLEMATFRYLVEERSDKDKERHVIGSSWTLLLVLVCFICIAATTVIAIFNIAYGWYVILAVVTGMILTFFQQVSRGLGRIVDYAVSGIISVVSTVIVSAALLVLMSSKVEGVIIGVITANLLSSLFIFVKLRLWRQLNLTIDKSLQVDMLRYALPLVPSTVSWWAIGAFGRTIITISMGAAGAGLYAVAYRMTMLFSGIPYVFNLSWTESATLSVLHDDRDAYYSRIANASLRVFCIAAAIMLLFMGLAYSWLTDPRYYEAYYLIPILMFGLLINSIVSYYHAIFAAYKDTKFIALSSIVAALVSVAVSVTLVKAWGVYGVACGAVAGYIVMASWCYLRVKKYVDVIYSLSNIAWCIVFLASAYAMYYSGRWSIVLAGTILLSSIAATVHRHLIMKTTWGIYSRIRKRR